MDVQKITHLVSYRFLPVIVIQSLGLDVCWAGLKDSLATEVVRVRSCAINFSCRGDVLY